MHRAPSTSVQRDHRQRARSTRSASASAARCSPPRWRCWRRAASSRPRAMTLLTDPARFLRHRRARRLRRREHGAACASRRSAASRRRRPDARAASSRPRSPSCGRTTWCGTTSSATTSRASTPPAFDLLYWNSDSTNLPGPMYVLVPAQHLPREQAARAGRADGVRRADRPRRRSTCPPSSTARARTTSCRGRRRTRSRSC